MNKVNNIQGLSYVNPEGIVPFENNPFEVRDDEEMKSLIESIREYGILTPLVVSRQGRRGDVIQLVSGHRRLHAAKKLGLQVVPVSYATMTPAEIAIAVVDSNLQREKILPSEKAKAYKLKFGAMQHQGRTSGQLVPKSDDNRTMSVIGEDTGESYKTVQRYIRLNNLLPELLKMVDEERIALTPAVELSYLTEDEQKNLLETISSEDATPSLSQACQMKRLSQAGILDMDSIFEIMVKPKANQKISLKIPIENVQKYVPNASENQLVEHIMKALEFYNQALQQQRRRNRDRDAR
ncbi:MAG: ParB/RepB/Spo0J family partition protein [Clostridia bacterium]|nr:ParB/RepB/Spo0J family partition protein [Clostridia bacterium]